MPNSRRRRFSVRNGIAAREPCKTQNGLQTSNQECDAESKQKANLSVKPPKSKHKTHPNSSKNSNGIEMATDNEISNSVLIMKQRSNPTINKNITTSSSTIDLSNTRNGIEDLAEPSKELLNKNEHCKIIRPTSRERTSFRREKPRQHRIKVRSPKRRSILDSHANINDTNKLIINSGTEVIDWDHESIVYVDNVSNVAAIAEDEDEERQSDQSLDDMCRICHGGDTLSQELGPLVSACSCRGTVGRVHVKCLERWLTESGKSRCELCRTRYAIRRVHRYGIPRAIVMWILSHNAKQLMVDSIGIMLMSPLAVLAAWLSGRTLAGLMTQDAQTAPWPLASTFVLTCMTLVCYYCWIVSAATRHALAWWIWYRSQYEVRLQLHEIEE